LTVTTLLKIGSVAQVASFGPYRRKVIDPVGLKPPARVAVSWIWPPTRTLADALVEIVGLFRPTETVSSVQSPAAALLLASPL
jgi:hypothetical protein